MRSNVVEDLLSGLLRPSVTVISDSLAQPALQLLRELIVLKLRRREHVCLVFSEIDSDRFVESILPDLEDGAADFLRVLDVNYDTMETQNHGILAYTVEPWDPSDLADLTRKLQHCNENGKQTTVFIDSLNTLETYSSSASAFRMLSRCPASLVALHHVDVPALSHNKASVGDHRDTYTRSTPLLDGLLKSVNRGEGKRGTLHLTLHPCAVLAHLHHVYGIDNVGQSHTTDDGDTAIDTRVYELLSTLQRRAWGSPLRSSVGDERDDSWDTGPESSNKTSNDGYHDTIVGEGLILDTFSTFSSTSSSSPGRCVAEYALRGSNVNASSKRSDAAKITRGLQGLQSLKQQKRELLDSVTAAQIRRLRGVPLAEVLRIKPRHAPKPTTHVSSVHEGGTGPVASKANQTPSNATDPQSWAQFNLSLTDRQKAAKDSAGLPYTPREEDSLGPGIALQRGQSEIVYQPDSADDMDDSDPDEDLDL